MPVKDKCYADKPETIDDLKDNVREAIAEIWFDTVGLFFVGCRVKDKCYADKPEPIDALKDNIHEAIAEIQLYKIDNVLKNLTERVGRGSHLNEIIFLYETEGLCFQIKK